MYLNKVQLIGNLTRDPELKALPSGVKVCNFSIATNRTWKDANGAKQEAVEFHNVIAFGRTAEVIAQYVLKGHQIFVEGRLQTRSWDKDGVKMYRTEIMVENFQFGNKPRDGAAPAQARNDDHDQSTPADEDTIEYPEEEINTEDIPF